MTSRLGIYRRKLLEEVGDLVSRHGFRRNLRLQAFRKETDFGKLSLHLAFINHSEDFDVTADVAVRFDEVEELIHEDREWETFSLGCELGNLIEGVQRRWTVRNSGDVPVVAKSIYRVFLESGLPYLERLSSKETALAVLRRDDDSAWLYSPFPHIRAQTAVALAIVTGKSRSEIATLVAEKRSFLDSVDDRMKASFEAFVERMLV